MKTGMFDISGPGLPLRQHTHTRTHARAHTLVKIKVCLGHYLLVLTKVTTTGAPDQESGRGGGVRRPPSRISRLGSRRPHKTAPDGLSAVA